MRWLDRLFVICVVLVVLMNLVPLGARLNWTLELTTHFRVQYLALTALLLAVAALRRRWRAVAVLAAAGAVSALAIGNPGPCPARRRSRCCRSTCRTASSWRAGCSRSCAKPTPTSSSCRS
jgi:hypothetical protein